MGFQARPKHKLVKWFGERPGKKKGDPETPEEEPKVEDDSELLGDLEPPTFEEEEEEEPEVVEEEEEEEEEESEEEEEEVKPAPQGKATPQRQMDTEGKS